MEGARMLWRGHRLVVLLAVLALALAACQSPPADNAGRKARIAALYAKYKADFSSVAEISPKDALELARQGRLLPIDTRDAAERAVSTLPGAVTPQDYLADPGRFGEKVPVAYCTIGYRSGVFAKEAAGKGLAVRNLAEGILGWLHAGGGLVDAQGRPVKTVHVYGRSWDLAPLDYRALW